ncbi:MAG: hypothetical protein COW18_08630 [Zetaproteobacteria bacterium CG12_big_fil_rev_8_21_14_0_65_54_13]|nr:MAG: hypothetical protein COX55_02180 [Zetaproteobacteria bacterium CG23_combo_of_CG06-09_8_20_14_all_54_7]PIW47677.1 MAG: hypothetical protein COW18_08630 [Zetaproteobacteria bacterium CG12_big_fil_rev_8_21_14_0_65_54_13]PIX54496.1 MAG: hypothetical protein COZ50_07560 [Zetaproteobacteria bacterium CG_4_10_14_3_um_filter_54_28]PJA28668.1 MAG: hypothetical protein CO188_08590 [Zetaproteobacteria bacterium CG_4_9_14_3_um_filter_54_145]
MHSIHKRTWLSGITRVAAAMLLMLLGACATHTSHVSMDRDTQKTVQVIGLPQFSVSQQIDIRQENPVYAIIGISAKMVQQVARQAKRIQYRDENPELLQECLTQMREGMKQRLRKQGYIVKDLDMTYWQALSGHRKQDPRVEGVDALLKLDIKQFGYFSGSPFKPYRPGMVMVADLVSMGDRKTLASNVYNVGFDREDISLLSFRASYATSVYVADERYFYKNFDTLLSKAKQSAGGLEFIARVAAESVAGDLKRRQTHYMVAKQ